MYVNALFRKARTKGLGTRGAQPVGLERVGRVECLQKFLGLLELRAVEGLVGGGGGKVMSL